MTPRPIGRPPLYGFASLRKGNRLMLFASDERYIRRIQFAASKHATRHGVRLITRQVKGGVQIERVR